MKFHAQTWCSLKEIYIKTISEIRKRGCHYYIKQEITLFSTITTKKRYNFIFFTMDDIIIYVKK